MKQRSHAPLWLMGLTNAVFGMYGGIVVISMPQLLSARRVPEATIAAMTAVMISPGSWAFLASPVLDVRFSRRWYAVATALAAAALLAGALLNLDNLRLVELFMVGGFLLANLYQSALGGWLSSITPPELQGRLSAWVTIGNLSGGGAMAVVTGELMRGQSPLRAALLLGTAILLPLAVFPWMPAPGPDRRLARESFTQFLGEAASLLRQRDVLVSMVLFLSPAAVFSLTNFLSGLGRDFQASTHFVGLVGGAGVFLGGICGCVSYRFFDRHLPKRLLYLAIGVAGALFTLALLLFARTPPTFAIALIGENAFQALAFTASTAIAFETIGQRNPLAATTFCLMISASNIPLTYMLFADSWGYAHHGVAGSLVVDAGLSLLTAIALAAYLVRSGQQRPRSLA
jgi:MFS transporter, PAT family, beta-lactamase induction signal transducer AmpG